MEKNEIGRGSFDGGGPQNNSDEGKGHGGTWKDQRRVSEEVTFDTGLEGQRR